MIIFFTSWNHVSNLSEDVFIRSKASSYIYNHRIVANYPNHLQNYTFLQQSYTYIARFQLWLHENEQNNFYVIYLCNIHNQHIYTHYPININPIPEQMLIPFMFLHYYFLSLAWAGMFNRPSLIFLTPMRLSYYEQQHWCYDTFIYLAHSHGHFTANDLCSASQQPQQKLPGFSLTNRYKLN